MMDKSKLATAGLHPDEPVGRVKGPGSRPHTFLFLAPDPAQRLKLGEFITYETQLDEQTRIVYGRISHRRAIHLYPDAFALDPEIDPATIAEMVGYQEAGYPLFEVTAAIIGYYDADVRDFINPRVDPASGRPVYLAADTALTKVLNKLSPGSVGAVHIGSLLSRETGCVPTILDGAALASTHLAVIASTGAGKSYLTAVIIEEMLKPHIRAAVLVIDPHSEYGTLAQMADESAFRAPGYKPQVTVYAPGDIKIKPASLTIGDLAYLLPELSERMSYLLHKAFYAARRQSQAQYGSPLRWSLGQLKTHIRQLGRPEKGEEGLKGYGRTADALIWRLDSVLGRDAIFADTHTLDLRQLCRPGHCAVLQLNEMGEKAQQVLTAVLLRRLLWARTQTEKGQFQPGHSLYLPYPVFVVVEEAHRFAPAAADVVSSAVLKEVLGEGRKFGVGLTLISQRPGKLDGDVISQCNTHCLLRIVNDLDQRRMAESVETVGRDLLADLPALSKGQVIVAGEAVSTPVVCQVRPRHTPHGAVSKNAPAEWTAYFNRTEKDTGNRV